MVSDINLSVVVPAYNEEARGLRENILVMLNFLEAKPYSWELIVVDDGSQDGTAAAVEAAAAEAGVDVTLLSNSSNRGKGYAVKRGVLAAKGRNIFFTDADLSTPIDEIDNLLPWLESFDIVIGSRALADSEIVVGQSVYRVLLGRVFRLLTRIIVISGIKDTMCGFKGYRREVARHIFGRQRLAAFGFDVETLYLAKKFGYSVAQRPITWRDIAGSRVNPIREGLTALCDLVTIRLNDLKGLYDEPRGKRKKA